MFSHSTFVVGIFAPLD